MSLVWSALFVVLAPFVAGFISGVDRIITAKMQSRIGPPLLQPFYDVCKLFMKQNLVVNRFYGGFILSSLVFTIASVWLFFAGQNILLIIFVLIVGNVFLVLAGYASNSPYSFLGAERELLQMLAAEPMILLSAVGFYMVTGSFEISDIVATKYYSILYLPGVFIGLTYVLTIKLRKSPFDLATSHHAHQELVKGLSTEFSGCSLAIFEIIHWYETILLLGFLYLFFANMPIVGIIAILIIYFLEIVVDNINARIKWELMLNSSWMMTLICGIGNLFILYFI